MAKTQPKQELVPLEDVRGARRIHTGRLYPLQETPLTKCPTSLDLSTDHGRVLAIAAGNPGDLELDKNGVLVIAVHDFLIVPDEQVDEETGELHQFVRTILFDAQGRTFRTTAAHAPHRIAAVMDVYGTSTWPRGVKLVIRARMGKRQRVYHDIRLVQTEVA